MYIFWDACLNFVSTTPKSFVEEININNDSRDDDVVFLDYTQWEHISKYNLEELIATMNNFDDKMCDQSSSEANATSQSPGTVSCIMYSWSKSMLARSCNLL